MSDSIIPAYDKWGDFALGNAVAHLLADVRERKNEPHSLRMLAAAMRELNARASAVFSAGSERMKP